MEMQFFMPMNPPTVTHQQQKIGVRRGRPYVYEPPELKDARAKLCAYLSEHRPPKPLEGALELVVWWCFPITGKHISGEYKISKPDTDNLDKLLKDCMTARGFWKDDAQVAVEAIFKIWSDVPGIYIRLAEIGGQFNDDNTQA